MSVISAFAGRLGSTSPNARAVIFSYAPTLPKVMPPNVGDSRRTTWSWVMRASATDTSESAITNTAAEKPKLIGFGLTPQEFLLVGIFSSLPNESLNGVSGRLTRVGCEKNMQGQTNVRAD